MPSSEVIEQLGSSPISDGAPAGESARYEPEFEALEAELAKLSSIEGGEVNWGAVVDNACTVLGSKSKDQKVACYLAYALLEQDGAAGLAAGLKVIDGICRNFWDSLFPAVHKLHAREQAFGWLTERVQLWFEGHPQSSANHDDLEAAAVAADELAQFCDERMAEVGGSGLFGFVRRLRELADDTTPAAEPEPGASGGDDWDKPSESATTPAAQSTAGAPKMAAIQTATPLSQLDTGSIQQVREEAFRRLRDLASFFSEAEPHSPVGPMLRRVSRWAEMDYRQLYAELLGSGQETLFDALGVTDDDEPAPSSGAGGGGWDEPSPSGDAPVDTGSRDDDW